MKLYRVLLVIIFFGMIITPALFMNRDAEQVSVIENKKVAPMPTVTVGNLMDGSVIPQIEEYVNDNIGFRQEIVLKNVSLMYRTLEKIEIPNYVEGKEQHLFYLTPEILKTYQGLDAISQEEKEEISAQMSELDSVLNDMGIEFLFMPIPNKEAIYGEYLPDGINIVNSESMLESVSEYIRSNTDVNVADVYAALWNAKTDGELLYYKNMDPTHWNVNGAFIGYGEIMRCLAEIDVRNLKSSDFDIIKNEVNKPISYLAQYDEFSSTFDEFYDYEYYYGYEYSGRLNNAVPDGFAYQNDVTNTYFHYENSNAINDKKLLVYGDSYIYTFMLPFLSESFSEVYFLSNSTSAIDKAELLRLVEPDVVIFEIVERMVFKELLSTYICGMKDAIGEISSTAIAEEIINQKKTNGAMPRIMFDDNDINLSKKIDMSKMEVDFFDISGWAIDMYLDTAPKMIVADVGGVYYYGEKYQRPDIATVKSDYLDSGFKFSFSVEDLKKATHITFYSISESRTYSEPYIIWLDISEQIPGGLKGEFEPVLRFDDDFINQTLSVNIVAGEIMRITGWCVDVQNNSSVLKVIAKVGGKEYVATIYERPDIANGNLSLLNAGLIFEIPTEALREAEKIEFQVISKYENTQLSPVIVQINRH